MEHDNFIEAQDLTIATLLDKIKRNEIKLPEMQRGYVWKKARVSDLLDSLYRGYPSGTILTWNTDENVTTRDFPIEQEKPGASQFQFLLDGQQRLTSLFAIRYGEPIKINGKEEFIKILFNLKHPSEPPDDKIKIPDSQKTFAISSAKLAKDPLWVSVTDVFKTDNMTGFLRTLLNDADMEIEDSQFDEYAKRLAQLQNIKSYPYRVYKLGRDKSYEEIVNIFVRVNSEGIKLQSHDLALAQISAKWQNSLEIFQEFERECIKAGFNFGLSVHIKNLAVFGTKKAPLKAVGSLPREQLETAWGDAKEGMRCALDFLKSNLKIGSDILLLSPFIVISLAIYGHLKKDRMLEEIDRLRYWVLIANAKARYSRGTTDVLLDRDLLTLFRNDGIDGLLKNLKAHAKHLKILPSDLKGENSRSAYFKTMFMAFREDEATDWYKPIVISLDHSGTQHKLQFHHIFPKSILGKEANISDEKVINDISNLAFISGKKNREIRDRKPADYLPEIIEKMGEEQLKKQCIPTDPLLWEINRYEDFLDARRELIADRLNEFIGHDYKDYD